MVIFDKPGILSAALIAAAITAATAQPQHYGSRAAPQLSAKLLIGVAFPSDYDPYASGMSPCPEGSPNGAPKKCDKLIPHSARQA